MCSGSQLQNSPVPSLLLMALSDTTSHYPVWLADPLRSERGPPIQHPFGNKHPESLRNRIHIMETLSPLTFFINVCGIILYSRELLTVLLVS